METQPHNPESMYHSGNFYPLFRVSSSMVGLRSVIVSFSGQTHLLLHDVCE